MSERVTWDPRDPAVLSDQRRAFDELRDRDAVASSDVLGLSVFGHRDVTSIAADPETFSSATRRLAIPNGMDPPQHTVFRAALERYFDRDRMAAVERDTRQIARDLLDPLIDRSDVEAIAEFVDPFAHQALCAFVGWPVEDWNRISGWTHGNQDAAFRRDPDVGARIAREFSTYVTEIIHARRTAGVPRDLMAELVDTSVDGAALSDEQIVSLLRTWTAGHGTVASAIGNVLLHLAEDQELQATVRAEPARLEPAIWEILRTDGPLVANNRTVIHDVDVHGTRVHAGERISLMWIAANRDPAVFPDPDRLDLDRDRRANLLFGAGIHRCLGEPLAILHLRVAVGELLRQFGSFELAPRAKPVRTVYPGNGISVLSLRLRAPGQAASRS